MWLRIRARFHSDAWIEHHLQRVHLRNARRIERTICEQCRVWFIKVGQLISIMTNFLPERVSRANSRACRTPVPRGRTRTSRPACAKSSASPRRIVHVLRAQTIASRRSVRWHLARMHDGAKGRGEGQ